MYFFVSFCQFLKLRQRTLNHLRAHAVRRAKIPGTAEIRSRHKQQIKLPRACPDCRIVSMQHQQT